MKRSRIGAIFTALFVLIAVPAVRAELTIAVASNFAEPMREIAGALRQHTGIETSLSVGSTGKLYAQVRHGAPYDIFLSADEVTAGRLIEEGLAERTSRYTYAVGKLALWSPRQGVVDSEGKVLDKLEHERLAIANPKLAPYGTAAIAVLTGRGLMQKLQNQLVYGENIAQTYQFVASGNADLGFVAVSQVTQARDAPGSVWIVPEHLYPPLNQDGVILIRSHKKTESMAAMEFLKSDAAKKIITAYGYAH